MQPPQEQKASFPDNPVLPKGPGGPWTPATPLWPMTYRSYSAELVTKSAAGCCSATMRSPRSVRHDENGADRLAVRSFDALSFRTDTQRLIGVTVLTVPGMPAVVPGFPPGPDAPALPLGLPPAPPEPPGPPGPTAPPAGAAVPVVTPFPVAPT